MTLLSPTMGAGDVAHLEELEQSHFGFSGQ